MLKLFRNEFYEIMINNGNRFEKYWDFPTWIFTFNFIYTSTWTQRYLWNTFWRNLNVINHCLVQTPFRDRPWTTFGSSEKKAIRPIINKWNCYARILPMKRKVRKSCVRPDCNKFYKKKQFRLYLKAIKVQKLHTCFLFINQL